MRFTGSPSRVRLTQGSNPSRPKVTLTLKVNHDHLNFFLGEVDNEAVAGSIMDGQITIEADKKPQQNGNFFKQGLSVIFFVETVKAHLIKKTTLAPSTVQKSNIFFLKFNTYFFFARKIH